jgi:hypothetical protein
VTAFWVTAFWVTAFWVTAFWVTSFWVTAFWVTALRVTADLILCRGQPRQPRSRAAYTADDLLEVGLKRPPNPVVGKHGADPQRHESSPFCDDHIQGVAEPHAIAIGSDTVAKPATNRRAHLDRYPDARYSDVLWPARDDVDCFRHGSFPRERPLSGSLIELLPSVDHILCVASIGVLAVLSNCSLTMRATSTPRVVERRMDAAREPRSRNAVRLLPPVHNL